jgi:hypothetical protein
MEHGTCLRAKFVGEPVVSVETSSSRYSDGQPHVIGTKGLENVLLCIVSACVRYPFTST